MKGCRNGNHSTRKMLAILGHGFLASLQLYTFVFLQLYFLQLQFLQLQFFCNYICFAITFFSSIAIVLQLHFLQLFTNVLRLHEGVPVSGAVGTLETPLGHLKRGRDTWSAVGVLAAAG